jgi:uncharacterized protein (DUF2249 family)
LKLDGIFEAELVSEIRNHVDQLLDQLEERHPGTFNSFQEELTSGDHLVISQSISRNAQLIYSTLKHVNQGNEPVLALIDSRNQPLARIIETNFPGGQEITAAEIREGLTSENFKRDMTTYFQNLNLKIDESNARAEDQMCLLWGAAVVAFAAIAIAVIYVIAVLNAVETANIVHYMWATESESTASSLLKEQIVNSVATNLYEGE